jgi:hypothetical protein
MNRLLCVVVLVIAACFLTACGMDPTSPRIVCDMDGKVVPTAFTFTDFKQTLAAEHGQVQAMEYKQIKTASLIVYFKPLEDGTVLAERAILIKTGQHMSPAVLFGLTNAPPAPVKLSF